MSMPKEPRQLMINLMYLVLTAMLALNVSSEILHAFKTINKSILSSNKSIEEKNGKIYSAFEQQLNQPATRDNIKPFYDKAQDVKKRSEEMMKYLDEWKEKIITRSGGYEGPDKKEIKAESDIDASTKLLVEAKGGDDLKAKITDLRNFFLAQVKPDDPKEFERQFPLAVVESEKTDNNPTGDWKTGYFQSMPVMAAVTLLAKFQNDVRNSEAMVLNQLNKEAGDTKINFDEIEAIAVPSNSYALSGQKVEAKILVAAYNRSVKPEVTKTSGNVTKVENGIAYWETTASGVGLQTVKGTVSIDVGKQKITKDYKFEYMVGSEGGSMQLDKMNVFYIGVPNPVTISAAGYSLEDVFISPIDGGTIAAAGTKGKFNISVTKPTGPEGIKVALMAKTAGGTKKVSEMAVRVKKIPNPIAKVAGKSGGSVPANVWRAQLGVVADLENFDFDARFSVVEFTYSVIKKRSIDIIGPYTVKSASWERNGDIMKVQPTLKAGDKIFIDEIKAVGPDGTRRSLNPIVFTLI